jgi:hypothetical protein
VPQQGAPGASRRRRHHSVRYLMRPRALCSCPVLLNHLYQFAAENCAVIPLRGQRRVRAYACSFICISGRLGLMDFFVVVRRVVVMVAAAFGLR